MYKKYSQTEADNRQQAFCRSNFRDKFQKFQQHFFNEEGGWPQRPMQATQGTVAANILEHTDYFEIQLFAAGRRKEAFKIELESNVLQVSYEEIVEERDRQYIHREYSPVSFKRAFQLNEQMLTESIHASYEDGILTIILPKDPAAAKAVKDVKID